MGEVSKTPKVNLRGVEHRDVEFIFTWAAHPEITRFTLGRRFPMQVSEIEEWIRVANSGEFPSRLAYLILDSLPIGLVTLDQIDWISRNGWLGVWIIPEARAAGRGTSAIDQVLQLAKEQFALRQIRLLSRSDNHLAISVYKKLGFEIEGELTQAEFREGEFHSLTLMRIDLNMVVL